VIAGVRRALGATKPRVYAIVLAESAILCAFGCFYGGLIGWMIFVTYSAEKWIERDFRLTVAPLPLAAMFLFVIALGIAGSLQGAATAAGSNPAEVLARKDLV
jgi:ABC-type antimicrobial peptide transport system permease subunit